MKLIDEKLLNETMKKAQESPRLRMNHNFHDTLDDPINRLINAMEPGTYLRPHRHKNPDKIEIFLVLRGKTALFLFDDEGTITESCVLDPKTGIYGGEIPADVWHTLLVLEPGTTVYEVKQGPYAPLSPENFAPWSPAPEDTEAVKLFMNKLMFEIAQQKYLQEKGYKEFSLKAVLFDMDGVLYDSMPNHAYSWVNVMKNNGLTMTDVDAYMNEGRLGVDTIELVAKREGKELSLDERKRIYKEKTVIFASCPRAPVMPGSLELVQKVTEKGLIAMLVTGSGQPSLLERLNQDFPNIFTRERMVTSFDVTKGKPHPEPYLAALRIGGLKPYEAVVVENAPLGIEAAHAAGLFVVAVNTGPLPDQVLIEAGADILFPSVTTASLPSLLFATAGMPLLHSQKDSMFIK